MSFNSRSLPPPTAEQKRRWALIRESGCVACSHYCQREPAEIHHLLSGGLRLGHSYTIGLCAWHHRGIWPRHLDAERMGAICGPSLALNPRKFRERFGSDERLLRHQDGMIGWTAPPVRERSRKRRATTRSSKTIERGARIV